MTTTNNEISDDQIRQLRTEAAQSGDHAQALLCDLALGDVELDDDTTIESLRIAAFIDEDDKRRISGMDPADYRAACEDVIRDAQVQGRTEEAWWDWHDGSYDRASASMGDAEARCRAWVGGESDDGPTVRS